ncbi:TetR/AcrR family transcriptional regulator [Rhodococcus sp. H29-C3]|uniref:TetR/AcrR family transcriptional regulator n=1 Tax=Rhodococcus sp. H29-C3 TaxID=3046307 RepID=UPI0024BA3A6F|nr:TetR/AcrR family transcriptional regulator [Rhodococcus sp. H29-C3]MDJ0362520.1 TetR/AcrR family transcriptional regulator [Rhodococcus sp. H29-C3]
MVSSATRGRPRSFDRDTALDLAIRLFWRKGYEATSVRDLSEELGIGTPSLYNAFGDKKALFTEAVSIYDREYGGFIEAAIQDAPTSAAAVRRILLEAPARYTRHGLPHGCLVASGDAGTTDSEIHDSLQHLRSEKAQSLSDRIRADISAGQLPEDTDADGLSGYVMTVISGLAQRASEGATKAELTTIADIATRSCP